jgi:arabinofuranosyltransferase
MGPPRRIGFALLGCALLFYAVLAYRCAWMSDDAYIALRTVDNFVNGHGLRWNLTERAQAYTHPLWMFLLAAVYAPTHSPYYAPIILSLGVSILAAAVLAVGIAPTKRAAICALLALACSKSYVDYSTSGLENPLTHLILATFLLIFLRSRPTRATLLLLSFLVALGATNRMDSLLLFLPALVYLWLRVPTTRSALLLAVGFAPLLLWMGFATYYYGFPFPNTAYAKLNTGIPSAALLRHGFYYFENVFRWDSLTLIVIVFGILWPFCTRQGRLVPIALGVGFYLLYILKIGGDFMGGRFFSAPFLCAVVILAAGSSRERVTVAAAVAIVLVILGSSLAMPRSPIHSGVDYGANMTADERTDYRRIADERAWYYPRTGMLVARTTARMPLLTDGARYEGSGPTVMPLSGAGMPAFFGLPRETHVIDYYALGNPLLARLPSKVKWRIGHFTRRLPPGYFLSQYENRNLIEHPALREYYDAVLLVTRGDLHAPGRLEAIWKLNTGGYDALLRSYCESRGAQLRLARIDAPVADGTPWDSPNSIRMRDEGCEIDLATPRHATEIEVSLSANDDYRFAFLSGEEEIASTCSKVEDANDRNLRVRVVAVPEAAQAKGFDRIRITPTWGDHLYVLGHLRLAE